MENKDTICLLKECDAGSKMAVASIDEVLESTCNQKLLHRLIETKKEHETLGNEIHSLLKQYQSEEKEPNPMAKGMSWLKTNVKLGIESGDATVADLITDGCNMGIKSLYRYLNQYSAANEISRNICKRLIAVEDTLCQDMRTYL